jgi:hypothetical protein
LKDFVSGKDFSLFIDKETEKKKVKDENVVDTANTIKDMVSAVNVQVQFLDEKTRTITSTILLPACVLSKTTDAKNLRAGSFFNFIKFKYPPSIPDKGKYISNNINL